MTQLRLLSPLALGAALLSPHAMAERDLSQLTLHALTEAQSLITIRADAPTDILSTVALSGQVRGERMVGIDYRVAYGVMFALGDQGRVYTVDTTNGILTPLVMTPFDEAPFVLPLQGRQFGFDFNPAADRIRIVTDTGLNLRAHPETGMLVDFKVDEPGIQPDGALHYVEGDPNHGLEPRLVAAAYTYNADNENITTNFAIDLTTQALVRQGSQEGVEPVISPNTGQLFSIGRLEIAEVLDAHFDISDIDNIALAAMSTTATPGFNLYRITLETGAAETIGPIGAGQPLLGIAIEP